MIGRDKNLNLVWLATSTHTFTEPIKPDIKYEIYDSK